jgi:alpha-ketoglutarate-dependent taurine dioxygenase
MSLMTIQISKITPGLGAETTGVDLTKRLSAVDIEGIEQPFLQHIVLVFRDQILS